MNTIDVIASVIAAITGIIAVLNTKGCIIKRIERKERQLQRLNNQFARTHGLNANMHQDYDTQVKKERLERSIIELRKRL